MRQLSTGCTGTIGGIHPVLPLIEDRKLYTVNFNFGHPPAKVRAEDLEIFNERRQITRRQIKDRRKLVLTRHVGGCVIQCLSEMLELPEHEIRSMFEESISGPRDQSDINEVVDVLIENDYMVGQISKHKAELGKRCLVILRNETGAGHVVVVEGKRVFDPERRFSETGGFYGMHLALGWDVDYVLVVEKIEQRFCAKETGFAPLYILSRGEIDRQRPGAYTFLERNSRPPLR